METLVEGARFSELLNEEDESSRGSSLSTETTASSSSSSEEKQSCGGGFEEISKEAASLGWPMAKNSEMGVGNENALAEEDEKIEKTRPSVSGI